MTRLKLLMVVILLSAISATAVGKPTVSISVDRSFVAQGDYLKVKAFMNTEQPITPINVFITGAGKTINICNYEGSGALSVKEACGADEWWVAIGLDYPVGTYNAKIDVGSGETRAEATAIFQVVNPEITILELTADRTTVARGGEIRFMGETTADRIYVYASEAGIFEYMAELPYETYIYTHQYPTLIVLPSDAKLDFKVTVKIMSSPGTYHLYVYAPKNPDLIDKFADTHVVIPINITDPRIVSVDIPSKIPYQGKFEVNVLTDPGKRENVELTFVIEGSNVKARPTDFGLSDYSTPDANNYVNWTIDLKRYKEGNKTLDPGLYLFTVKMRFKGGDEIDSARTSKLIEIVDQQLDVGIFIELNKTTVAPGEQFAVDVSVKDGTAKSVVAEFTFDTAKIKYVSKSTSPSFTVLSSVSDNKVSIAGISDEPVDISAKTKLATIVFEVNPGATGEITFNCITANVDGQNVQCNVGSLTIATEPWQSYDKNSDEKIDTGELINAIKDWLMGNLDTLNLIKVIQKWLQG